jgi:hypothetical protein
MLFAMAISFGGHIKVREKYIQAQSGTIALQNALISKRNGNKTRKTVYNNM